MEHRQAAFEEENRDRLTQRGVMASLKAGSGLYRLTADCPAILLADYSRDDRKVTLAAGTIFSVKENAGTVGEHPGVQFSGVSANGQRYRVEATVLAEKSSRL